MSRPYIICHMTMSLDGKVTGEYLLRPEHEKVSEIYYELNRNFKADAYACGRVTMEGSFTGGWYPSLNVYQMIDSKEDYIAPELSGFYAVAFDPHGRLGWKTDKIIDVDQDPGYDNAQIIEVLTRQVDGRYLSYLQSVGISYIFAGENEIDVKQAVRKLKTIFGIQMLLLEGGSILNGAFQRAGVIDELSLVVDQVIGAAMDKPLFTEAVLCDYMLCDCKNHDGILWLNYKKK